MPTSNKVLQRHEARLPIASTTIADYGDPESSASAKMGGSSGQRVLSQALLDLLLIFGEDFVQHTLSFGCSERGEHLTSIVPVHPVRVLLCVEHHR